MHAYFRIQAQMIDICENNSTKSCHILHDWLHGSNRPIDGARMRSHAKVFCNHLGVHTIVICVHIYVCIIPRFR